VYARKVQGRLLTFGVSGMLWNRSLVMYDSETGSHWSHILGQAMDGELKGTTLEMLPSEMTTWAAWLEKHPETSVLNMSRTHKDFTREFYKDAAQWVYGWTIGRKRYHIGIDVLTANPLQDLSLDGEELLVSFDTDSTLAQLFSRRLEGKKLSFTAAEAGQMKDTHTGSLWSVKNGIALEGPMKGKRLESRLGMLSYKRAWNEFYPSSVDAGLPGSNSNR